MRSGREWAGATGRYGAAGESGAWKVVYDHYYWDRLKEAYTASLELGAGSAAHGLVGFRMIEGEWFTREKGTITKVNDWLSVEAILEELPETRGKSFVHHPLPSPGAGRSLRESTGPVPRGRESDAVPRGGREPDAVAGGGLPALLVEQIIDACDHVARRFGYEHGPPVMVSALAAESNVPWMPGRHGYCIDKHPYDKICVPNYSLHDHDDLEHVVQHEYAHVISLNLSQGQCPHWLDEAVAMVAGGGVDRRAWRLLSAGVAEWRDPVSLDMAFMRNREDDGERQDVWLAYQQSAVIGFYLSSLKGEKGLADLLRGYSNNTLMQDILMRVRGVTGTDEALKEVYGFGTRELFEKAREWLVGGGV